MSKFNQTKSPVLPTVVNEMGERAYLLKDKENLVSMVLTTFLSSSYYETEQEIIKNIKSAIEKVDTLFIAKLALYVRNEANMRSVSHLLAGELAKRLSGTNYGSKFYERVAVRPDDMSEILSYYALTNGSLLPIPNAIKKGFRKKLQNMDAYLIDKYKMSNKELSLIDLVNLLKPKPTQENSVAYNNLMKGISLEGLYTTRIFEKEMSKAGVIDENSTKTVEEQKEEAIESVLANVKGMPIFNLVRNLRNILQISPKSVDQAIAQLTTRDKILGSRMLPFRFASAYDEISNLNFTGKTESTSEVLFESDAEQLMTGSVFEQNKQKVLNALEEALKISCENIPVFQGKTAVLIDHSGSVRGDGGGSSTVSAFSKTSTAMIGNLFGSLLAYSQNDTYIGMFGDRLIATPIDRKIGVLQFNKRTFDEGSKCGGGTENGLYIFLDQVIRSKTKVDTLVIFSDMVIGSGGEGGWDRSSNARLGSFQTLFKEFKKINPQCLTVTVNIQQTGGKSVFDKSLNVVQVSGWSDKIFDVIKTNKVGYKELINTIEKINI